MKVVADFDECEANAVCMGIAPEVFEVDEQDFLNIKISGDIPAELEGKVREAVAMCPKRALFIQED